MSTPRKRLPVKPSTEHLRKQAKRRQKLTPEKPLVDHQHEMALEYGCKNWAELMHMVETMLRGADQLQYVKYEMEALPKAANNGDIERVREILASGEFTQHDLDLALARALFRFKDTPELAELILEHGADVDGQYGSDYGPIVIGCGECLQPESFQFMIDNGCDITFAPVKTKYGPASPMLHTIYSYVRGRNEDKHRCIEILEQNGAWMPPETEVTTEMWAIHKGDARGLAAMLDADPSLVHRRFPGMLHGNIGLPGATLLHMAVEFSEIACINVLLDRGADINARAEIIDGIGGQTPVFHAAQNYPYWKAKALPHIVKRVGEWLDTSIQAKVKLHGEVKGPATVMELFKDEKEVLAMLEPLDVKTRLKNALRNSNIDKAKATLDTHPESLGIDLWPAAIIEGKSLASTKFLAEAGLSVDECSAPRKPLHLAVYPFATEIVEYLLQQGADPNQRNPLGETPLELLNTYDTRPVDDPDVVEIRRLLLSAGAQESIFSLIASGTLEALKELLTREPDQIKQRVPVDDLCPLSVAAVSGRLEAIEVLLEAGAVTDTPNKFGNTPLWFVAGSAAPEETKVRIAKRLLAAGANPTRPCEDNKTPINQAEDRGLKRLAQSMQSG